MDALMIEKGTRNNNQSRGDLREKARHLSWLSRNLNTLSVAIRAERVNRGRFSVAAVGSTVVVTSLIAGDGVAQTPKCGDSRKIQSRWAGPRKRRGDVVTPC